LQPESLSPLDRRLALFSALTALGIVIFFSLDVFLQSIALKELYLKFAPLVMFAVMSATAVLCFRWKSLLFVLIVPALAMVLSVYLLDQPNYDVVLFLGSTVLCLGIIIFLPIVVFVIFIRLLIAIAKRGWREAIVRPSASHAVTLSIQLLVTAYLLLVQSRAVSEQILAYQSIESHEYYLTGLHFGSTSTTDEILLYRCNQYSIGCIRLLMVVTDYRGTEFLLTHSEDKLIIVIDGQPVTEIPVGAG
jgi:hypothetical protein